MTDLVPLCALGGATPRETAHGALSLREEPALGLASLALPQGMPAPAPFGLALPGPGGWAEAGPVAAFWMAPGQWMIAAAGRGDDDFAASLAAEAPGCAITEQTDGWVALDVASSAGPAPIAALLERLVNIPPERLGPGCAVRTGLHHMSVFVLRPAGDRMIVLGMRSAAESLWHALETAAAQQAALATPG